MQGPKTTLAVLALTLAWGCTTEIGDPHDGSLEEPGPMGPAPAPPSAAPTGTPGAPGTSATSPSSPAPSAPNTSCTPSAGDTGANVLRRLSLLEYQSTLQDLFALPSPPNLEGIPADTDKEGFKIFAEVQSVSAQHLRAYLEKATELADALIADKARFSKVVGCEATAQNCIRSFVEKFGSLAWRRPLEADEIQGLVSKAETHALDTLDQFRFVIEALLSSSNFLYRVEVGDSAEGLSTLKPHELAARLSFGLWGRAPSAELLARAEQGALSTAEGLGSTADAMLKDEKAQLFFGAFFRQWLRFDTLRAPVEAPMGWSNALMASMQAETDGLLREYAWSNKNFLEVLTANHTFASADLAKFYGLPTPSRDGLLEFPETHVRANTGILTHPSLLSAKSDGDLIAIRGNWLRRTFLCQEMTIPASLTDEIGELLVGLTPVEIVERRNTEASCKGCHAVIDPIGVGFAQFDALGRYDSKVDLGKYGIAPGLVDAPIPEFASIAELSEKLRALPETSACLVEKLFTYVNGRSVAPEDSCSVESASQAFTSQNLQFPALVKGLIEAPAFRLRRAPTPAP